MSTNVFRERSLCVASDLSHDELLYLYDQGRRFKEAWNDNGPDRQRKLAAFRINSPHLGEYMDPDFGVYDAFFEPSTRTEHSSKSACLFHFVKHLSFDPGKSSLSKQESYADTFMTLAGYNSRIFIVRTTLEGVCRWLSLKGRDLHRQGKLPFVPAFINAGDGKHEHPTQELLDEFTFLEDNQWRTDHIHVALIGDLLHGRTVHSKVQGLGIFREVEVDLVAPADLQMPEHYVRRMRENGFVVRFHDSLEAYYRSGHVAPKQYFTRPQLERMGDEILKRQDELRQSITFRKEWMSLLPEGTSFYHPFPRHREHPTIPEFVDSTPLNRYFEQSNNGRVMRIILLAAIAGRIGQDFVGETLPARQVGDDFVQTVPIGSGDTKVYAQGVNPLADGVVIDHVCRGEREASAVWDYLFKVMNTMKFNAYNGSCHVGVSKKDGTYKGLIFLPHCQGLTTSEMRRLSAITGGCTVNHVAENRVQEKMRLTLPPRIYGIAGTGCRNKNCISHESHLQHVPPEFLTGSNGELTCVYCDTPHPFRDIWR